MIPFNLLNELVALKYNLVFYIYDLKKVFEVAEMELWPN